MSQFCFGCILSQLSIYMIDDRYIVEEYDGGIRITMKVYKEWVAENGKPQVFHKTDTVGFKSPLVKEDYE